MWLTPCRRCCWRRPGAPHSCAHQARNCSKLDSPQSEQSAESERKDWQVILPTSTAFMLLRDCVAFMSRVTAIIL